MAQVHYWELSNYNNGVLLGRWFDLDGKTYDEHKAEIAEWLEELTEETGELCEEYILGDVEGVPSTMHYEYGINEEFFEYAELVEAIGEDAAQAAMELGIPADKAQDAYIGHYDTVEDLVWEYIEGGVYGDIPDAVRNYLDIESMARDLRFDILEQDGHCFNANY